MLAEWPPVGADRSHGAIYSPVRSLVRCTAGDFGGSRVEDAEEGRGFPSNAMDIAKTLDAVAVHTGASQRGATSTRRDGIGDGVRWTLTLS